MRQLLIVMAICENGGFWAITSSLLYSFDFLFEKEKSPSPLFRFFVFFIFIFLPIILLYIFYIKKVKKVKKDSKKKVVEVEIEIKKTIVYICIG